MKYAKSKKRKTGLFHMKERIERKIWNEQNTAYINYRYDPKYTNNK